jgi:hypothetical protein
MLEMQLRRLGDRVSFLYASSGEDITANGWLWVADGTGTQMMDVTTDKGQMGKWQDDVFKFLDEGLTR